MATGFTDNKPLESVMASDAHNGDAPAVLDDFAHVPAGPETETAVGDTVHEEDLEAEDLNVMTQKAKSSFLSKRSATIGAALLVAGLGGYGGFDYWQGQQAKEKQAAQEKILAEHNLKKKTEAAQALAKAKEEAAKLATTESVSGQAVQASIAGPNKTNPKIEAYHAQSPLSKTTTSVLQPLKSEPKEIVVSSGKSESNKTASSPKRQTTASASNAWFVVSPN